MGIVDNSRCSGQAIKPGSEIPVSNPDIRIFLAGIDRLDDLEPLWKALHEHHAALSPHLGPTRSLEESWTRRRARYEQWLADDGLLFIAERDGVPVGYGIVHLEPGSEIWRTGDLIAKIHTMCVLPDHRSANVGTALVEAGAQVLQPMGIEEASFSCMATNESAIRFFESFGALHTMVNFRARVV
jgi:ribosomal protein S18 acetylase RimI-like enzyme